MQTKINNNEKNLNINLVKTIYTQICTYLDSSCDNLWTFNVTCI